MRNPADTLKPDHTLDITSDVCPMTFVRTKLCLEKMQPGEVLLVRLKNKEPLENVPRSVREIGHHVLSITPDDPDGADDAIHTLLIQIKA